MLLHFAPNKSETATAWSNSIILIIFKWHVGSACKHIQSFQSWWGEAASTITAPSHTNIKLK